MAGAAPLQSRPSSPAVVGLLEAIGQLSERELFVGGWSKQKPEPGSPVLVVTSDGVVEARWHAAWSDRPDVGPDRGFAGLVQLDGPMQAEAVLAVQFSARAVLGVYEHRLLFDSRQSTSRLRAVGPLQMGGHSPLAEAVSRYDGTDSVAGSALPIRLGIDDCVSLGDTAVLVSGWLFDPEGLVRRVDLTRGSVTQAISESWIVRRRADVLASICAEPRFSLFAESADHCGFTAIVHGLPDKGEVYLSLATGDGSLHAPLNPRDGNARVLLAAILAGIDPDLPSSLDVAEKLVAPVTARLVHARPTIARCDHLGLDRGAPLSLVIGCRGDADDVATLLATLSTDPHTRNTPIVIAAPAPELSAVERGIRERADFFGLRVMLVGADGIADHVDALVAGALAAEAERVCLLAGDIVPDQQDWLSKLVAVHPLRPAVLVPRQFDHATFGPHGSQRERSRIHSGVDCCLAPRDSIVAAYDGLGVFLDRANKSRALLSVLEDRLQRIDVLDVDMLNGGVAAPSGPLLGRVDRAAAIIRTADGLA